MVLLCWAAPLAAQTESNLAERIRTLEQQMVELTRRLSDGASPGDPPGSLAGANALADRVAALEAEVTRLLREFPSSTEEKPAGAAPLRQLEAASAASGPPLQTPLPSLQRSGAAVSPAEESRLPVSGYMEMNFSRGCPS